MFEINSLYKVFPLFIIPAFINVLLCVYVIFRFSGTTTNRIFALFVFMLAVAQFADGMMHLSVHQHQAELWQRLSFVPWVLITAAGTIFVLDFSQIKKLTHRNLHFPALLLPAFALEFLVASGMCQHSVVQSENWGWIANPIPSPSNNLVYIFVSGVSLLMPVLLWYSLVRYRKDAERKTPILILAIGITIPYVAGLIAQVILPFGLGHDSVPLAAPFMTVFTIAALFAIQKYRVLDFTPVGQVDRIVETMNEGLLMMDKNGNLMYTNEALRRLLGYSQDDLRNRHINFLLNDAGNVALEEPTGSCEVRLKSKTGVPIWVVSSPSQCLDAGGQQIGTTWTVMNVDGLKRSKAEILLNEQRLNRAQAATRCGSWEMNLETQNSIWSDELCRIYGLSPAQNVQPFSAWLERIHPGDKARVLEIVSQSHNSHSDAEFENRIVAVDGTVKHVRTISKYIFDEHNTAVGVHGVTHDITELKIAEEKNLAATNELETYIYKSSHDLHAPLSSILGLINVGKLEITDPVSKNYMHMIEEQASKLENIRAAFIRAMHIKNEIHLDDRVLVHPLINEILNDLKHKNGFSRLQINLGVCATQVMTTNAHLLKTVLLNLISNAIKFQDYARHESFLNIDFFEQGNIIEIIVEDNGVGIDQSLHHRIFEMHFRADASSPGSGLGLYLAKKAMMRMGGKINFVSSAGRGTKITMIFETESKTN